MKDTITEYLCVYVASKRGKTGYYSLNGTKAGLWHWDLIMESLTNPMSRNL